MDVIGDLIDSLFGEALADLVFGLKSKKKRRR